MVKEACTVSRTRRQKPQCNARIGIVHWENDVCRYSLLDGLIADKQSFDSYSVIINDIFMYRK